MTAYKGIAFPFGKSSSSLPATVEDEELVRQSLVQIATTARGERIMRPDLGSNSLSYVFESNNEVLAELIRSDITTAIEKFEPRAIVRDVQTTRSDNEVVVTIFYIVALTGTSSSVAITVPTSG